MILTKTNIRRAFAVCMSMILILVAIPPHAFAAGEILKSGVFSYTLSESGASIVGCDRSVSGALQIPQKLDGVQVVFVDGFDNCDGLTQVTVPQGVTEIGYYAFGNCRSLASVSLPNSLKKIGDSAFYGTALTIMVIPDAVETIGDYAFHSCSRLSRVVLPANLKTLGRYAFLDCDRLTDISFPNSLQDMGADALDGTPFFNSLKWSGDALYAQNILLDVKTDATGVFTMKSGTTLVATNAFSGCTKITEIVCADTLTAISAHAFYYYHDEKYSLKTVRVPDSVQTIGSYAFPPSLEELHIGSGLRYDEEQKWWSELTSLKTFTISEENKNYSYTDGMLMDADRTKLLLVVPDAGTTDLVIPDTVDTIEDYAFAGNTAIERVTVPDSVRSIGTGAFWKCTNLEQITLGSRLLTIGISAFQECTSLQSVRVPNSVTSIAYSSFRDCAALQSVTLPTNLQKINWSTFMGCSSLKDIAIPQSVSQIQWSAFADCASLQQIELPAQLTEIDSYLFSGCSALQEIRIPDGLEYIYYDAFKGCASLTEVNIPDSVTWIGGGAFRECAKLRSVRLPSGLKAIEDRLFLDSALESVTIPETVERIETEAFSGTNLTSVRIPANVKSIESRAFYNCGQLTTIEVSDTLQYIGRNTLTQSAFYTDASNWKDGVLYLNRYLISAEKTISGKVSVKTGTLLIGNAAFMGCKTMTGVEIPQSVTTICDSAFYGCESLGAVTLPSSLKEIYPESFAGCKTLSTVSIPRQVTEIGYAAFMTCAALQEVRLPKTLELVGDAAFRNCSALADVRYEGTQQDWDEVYIGVYNEDLENASFRFGETMNDLNQSSSKGVIAEYYDSCFGEEAYLRVESEQQEENPLAKFQINIKGKAFTEQLYYVHMQNADGDYMQPKEGQKITLRFPAPTDEYGNPYAPEQYRIFHVDSENDKKTESFTTTKNGLRVEDGYLVIEVSRFSPFIVVVQEYPSAISLLGGEKGTLPYGERRTLTIPEYLPNDAMVVWTADNNCVTLNPSADGRSCEVLAQKSGNVTVTATVIDKDGAPVEQDGELLGAGITFKTKAGFFHKLWYWIFRFPWPFG